jgi:glycosyltransferase involved in cell wall biosynthesis
VFGQTARPTEIIVVDDGSTDGTATWLKDNFPEIRLIEQENCGVSSARNIGIQISTTEWIAFLDSDDCWLPEKLDKQMKALEMNSKFQICHTEERWIYRGKERPVPEAYRKKHGWIFEHCLPVCAISPSTTIIHRSVFDEVGLFDERLPACEDYDLWLRITSRMPVLLVDEPLIEKHGGHKDQLSGQWGLDKWRIQALQKVLGEQHLSEEHRGLAKAQLRVKCQIFSEGLEKHGKVEEAEYYRSLMVD